MLVRTLGPEVGWIVRSHIGWGGEQNILYKGVETSHEHSNQTRPSQQTRFKNIERKSERESPKRSISASGELGLLQIVSESDTEQCASEEAEPQKGVDTRRCQ